MQSVFVRSGSEEVVVWWQSRRHTTADAGYQAGHWHTEQTDRTAAGGELWHNLITYYVYA